MKRKELLSKSLAVGLAVAMAVASMSTSGGLFAPVEVYAQTGDPVSATKDMFEVKDAEGNKVTLADAAEDAEIRLAATDQMTTGVTFTVPKQETFLYP